MHEGELEEKDALKKQANKPERLAVTGRGGSVACSEKISRIVEEIQFDHIRTA